MWIITWLWLLIHLPPANDGINLQLSFADQSEAPSPPVFITLKSNTAQSYCSVEANGYSAIQFMLDQPSQRVTLLPQPPDTIAYTYDIANLSFLLTMGIKQLNIAEEMHLLKAFTHAKPTIEPGDKLLHGYTCKLVTLRTAKGKLSAWVAPKIKGRSTVLVQQWRGLPYLEDVAILWSQLDNIGFPLSITYQSSNPALKGTINVENISLNAPNVDAVFDLSRYSIKAG